MLGGAHTWYQDCALMASAAPPPPHHLDPISDRSSVRHGR
jgi:hypothetical protein